MSNAPKATPPMPPADPARATNANTLSTLVTLMDRALPPQVAALLGQASQLLLASMSAPPATPQASGQTDGRRPIGETEGGRKERMGEEPNASAPSDEKDETDDAGTKSPLALPNAKRWASRKDDDADEKPAAKQRQVLARGRPQRR